MSSLCFLNNFSTLVHPVCKETNEEEEKKSPPPKKTVHCFSLQEVAMSVPVHLCITVSQVMWFCHQSFHWPLLAVAPEMCFINFISTLSLLSLLWDFYSIKQGGSNCPYSFGLTGLCFQEVLGVVIIISICYSSWHFCSLYVFDGWAILQNYYNFPYFSY